MIPERFRNLALALIGAVFLIVAAFGGGNGTSPAEAQYEEPVIVERINMPYVCSSAVDIDLVRVSMPSLNDDALILRRGCTGRIGRVEIDTWMADGIKTRAQGAQSDPLPHDLVIESGYVRCHAVAADNHQDGVQVQVGNNLLFRDLFVGCGLSNAQFFVSGSGVHDVVCETCDLGPDASHTANVAGDTNGVRDSLLCKPDTHRYYTKRGNPVDENNVRAPAGDPRCE